MFPNTLPRRLGLGLGAVSMAFLFGCGGGDDTSGGAAGGAGKEPSGAGAGQETAGSGDSGGSGSHGGGGTAADASATKGATVAGRVKFEGDPPAAKKIDLSGTPQCAELHTDAIFSEKIVVGPDGGVRHCIVYVDFPVAEDDDRFPVPSEPALLDQVGCVYVPHVLGIRCDQELTIKSSDPVSHNVHYDPKNNDPDNIGMPKPGVKIRKFSAPDFVFPIRFVCDMHKWMEAYVAVFPHPFFAVTDAEGRFSIPGVPAGSYHVKVWHETKGLIGDVEVSVPESGSVDVPEFSLTK